MCSFLSATTTTTKNKMNEKQPKQTFFTKYLALFRHKIFHKGLFTGVVFTATYTLVVGSRLLEKEKAALKESLKAEFIKSGNLPDESKEDAAKIQRAREILKYGMPDRGPQLRYYTNHVLAYDRQRKTPVWVAEHITKNSLQGDVSRKNVRFRPDPGVLPEFSAANTDYWDSGWSRGHMNPAGDNKYTQSAMVDSFYLSNIVPQNIDNNGGFWNRLEIYCRKLAKKYSNVYIISGPLVLPETGEDGKQFVKYPVIGENQVAVPTHLFKVILVEDMWKSPKAMGVFVVPNKPIGYKHQLAEYQVPLKDLEKMTGINFTPMLKEPQIANLCEVDGCKLMQREEFELYFIGRKLQGATTINRVEKVWNELEEKKLEPSKYLTELYTQKKSEIQNLSKPES